MSVLVSLCGLSPLRSPQSVPMKLGEPWGGPALGSDPGTAAEAWTGLRLLSEIACPAWHCQEAWCQGQPLGMYILTPLAV